MLGIYNIAARFYVACTVLTVALVVYQKDDGVGSKTDHAAHILAAAAAANGRISSSSS